MLYTMLVLRAFAILFTLISASVLSGRQGELEEVFVSTQIDADLQIKSDGSFVQKSKENYIILNAAGIDWALSQLTKTYESTICQMRIDNAYSVAPSGEKYIVSRRDIEDKELASDPLGLTQSRQILVPFRHVLARSGLYLEYTLECQPQLEKTFNRVFEFSGPVGLDAFNLKVHSELPLNYSKIDPGHNFEITSDQGHKNIKIHLVKPLSYFSVTEPEESFLFPNSIPRVFLSSEKDYERVGKLLSASYQKVLSQSSALPEKLLAIRNAVENVGDEVSKIEYAIAYLIQDFRYLGTWNTIDGFLLPRSLEKIAETGYADCKEFATALVAILRSLGFRAYVAFVHKEDQNIPLDDEIYKPNILIAPNHAIVKVIGPSGQTYWVDPTNLVSLVRGIHPNIAGVPALVLTPSGSLYEHTPEIDFHKSRVMHTRTIDFDLGNRQFHAEGTVFVDREAALQIVETRAAVESHTKLSDHDENEGMVAELIVKTIARNQGRNYKAVFTTESPFRIVGPQEVDYAYDSSALIKSNQGSLFVLDNAWQQPITDWDSTNIGALDLGLPGTIERVTNLKNVTADDLEALASQIESPWVTATRELSETPTGLQIIEKIELKKRFPTQQELQSDTFKTLKDSLESDWRDPAILLMKK